MLTWSTADHGFGGCDRYLSSLFTKASTRDGPPMSSPLSERVWQTSPAYRLAGRLSGWGEYECSGARSWPENALRTAALFTVYDERLTSSEPGVYCAMSEIRDVLQLFTDCRELQLMQVRAGPSSVGAPPPRSSFTRRRHRPQDGAHDRAVKVLTNTEISEAHHLLMDSHCVPWFVVVPVPVPPRPPRAPQPARPGEPPAPWRRGKGQEAKGEAGVPQAPPAPTAGAAGVSDPDERRFQGARRGAGASACSGAAVSRASVHSQT